MRMRLLAIAAFFIAANSTAQAQFYVWLGNGPDNNFSTAANWQSSLPVASGPDVVVGFGGNTLANFSVTSAVIDSATATSGSPAAFELSQMNFGPVNINYSIGIGAGSPAVRFLRTTQPVDIDDIIVQSGRTATS